MSAYFVAAIGTGIGKTFTSCALLHAAVAKNIPARGLKPVISGFTMTDDKSDSAQLLVAQGIAVTAERIASISPWRFTAPLSPHRAAAMENTSIDLARLIDWTHEQVKNEGLILIETVGGVMVPLNDQVTTLDWMAAIGFPIILVAGSYLGAINHTLMTLACLRARGLTVAALVLNESEGSTVTLAEAEAGLAPFIADIPLKIVQPLVSSWKDARSIHALLGGL